MSQIPQSPVIMQIIPSLGAGGAEQGCIDVAAEIMRGGAKAIVVSNAGSRVHELARVGATHIDLPVHSKNPVTMWRNIKRLRKIINEHNVDIVHVRSRAPAWSALRACHGTQARFMTTCHAPYNISGKAKRFYNSAIAKGERVIAISRYVADYLLENYKIDRRNIRLIHRGIALERFHPNVVTPAQMIKLSTQWRLPDEASIILMPGRLTRWKGHHVLIEAMARLGRPDVFCVIIGSDQGRESYRNELEDQVRALGLEKQVRIVDHCDDMPAAYMLSTVVVSASTDPEGFGRVPVEAQAMGKPVIATDHGGAKETVLRNETGWLIPPEDPESLVQCIHQALDLTPSQRSILATQAMNHVVQNFTREKMMDKTMNVYAEILQEKYDAKPFSASQGQTTNKAA
ncbi:MAG: glycosyltransferase family 4 protein [Alphaproteobacteria bacterium]|nr:glycosyltransferase family 4 protein [Alphaproteobacteria bacterium]